MRIRNHLRPKKKYIMELDNLKNIWQEFSEKETDSYNVQEIKELLSGKSKGVIATIQQHLQYEIIITGIVLVFFAIMPFVFSGSLLKILMGIWGLLCIVYLFFYRQKYLLVKTTSITNDNLKSVLDNLVVKLHEYTKIYFWSNVLLIPFLQITNYILAEMVMGDVFERFSSGYGIYIFVAYILISSLLMVAFFRWYVRKMYGTYISQLEDYLEELKEF